MPKSIPAFLLLLALLCIPLRADEKPVPKNIIAMLLVSHQVDVNKPFANVLVSTKEESDPALKKWMKRLHPGSCHYLFVRVTADEMDTISKQLHEGNLKPSDNGYLASCLNADGQTDFLLEPKVSVALFTTIAKCNIPASTREELLGAAHRM